MYHSERMPVNALVRSNRYALKFLNGLESIPIDSDSFGCFDSIRINFFTKDEGLNNCCDSHNGHCNAGDCCCDGRIAFVL